MRKLDLAAGVSSFNNQIKPDQGEGDRDRFCVWADILGAVSVNDQLMDEFGVGRG